MTFADKYNTEEPVKVRLNPNKDQWQVGGIVKDVSHGEIVIEFPGQDFKNVILTLDRVDDVRYDYNF